MLDDETADFIVLDGTNSSSLNAGEKLITESGIDFSNNSGESARPTIAVDVSDFLSNGVKIRGIFAPFNSSGQTIMYAAFSENPFAGTTPATAR